MVRVLSAQRLTDLHPRKGNWVEIFRGRPASPWLAAPTAVVQRNDLLYLLDSDQNVVWVWNLHDGTSRRMGDDGSLKQPVGLAVDDDGRIYVADAQRQRVVIFSAGGEKLRDLQPPGEAVLPIGLAIHGRTLWVSDSRRHLLHRYDLQTDAYLGTVGSAGSGKGQFSYPAGLAVGPDGLIYVADRMNHRVQLLDAEGHYVRSIGHPGNRFGSLGEPRAVALSSSGLVMISDAQFGCVHIFDSRGRLLLVVGGPGAVPSITPMPNGLAVSSTITPSLYKRLPPDFEPTLFFWVTSLTGNRLTLFAVRE
ncbi:MAG: hypothetical protein HJJLKODD_00616 [Phycisphaerae bacterium]|nr:hypothetical protein [Phycisphaerae bacterium]